jgi:predicted  nucleic acid-binding Zn-ribbon protein
VPTDDAYLLRRIDAKVDQITDKLEQKADREQIHLLRSDIAALEMRVRTDMNQMDGRVRKVEEHDRIAEVLDQHATSHFTRREKLIGLGVALVAVSIGVATFVLQLLGYH